MGIATAQDQQAQSGIGERVQHLMSIEVGFEQMVPPGMSIEAKEVSRKGTTGKDHRGAQTVGPKTHREVTSAENREQMELLTLRRANILLTTAPSFKGA